MASFTSHPVDTIDIPSYFSSFPVRSCESEAFPTIQKALKNTISRCTAPGSKERRKAEYRHANPAGNLFGLCLTLCRADRIGYVAQLIEFLCIVDDVMEDLPFAEAIIEHELLRQALHEEHDDDHYTSQVFNGLKDFLRDLRVELTRDSDPSNLTLLHTLDISLQHRDSVDTEFQSLEDYIPYRKMNFDFECVFIQFYNMQ
ncbi:hypothetical protein BDP27DRAFT_1327333 [Rhodocollybia butyracea]|uniref:Uncharacterized protein n=1 Tax=Rhodocollybia butyracea TaxID=206335 RepID=A0A9P5PM67_9AGAR|nr:hypothetical protein BDP27DRAFT_1327333 [Rhodocollybia butyracea]